MSRATILAAARRAAERGMTDVVTIRRTTAVTTNRVTGEPTPTVEVVYGPGPGRFQQPGGYGRNAAPTPPNPAIMHYRILQLPVATSAGLRQGDEVEVITAANDPSLQGKILVVRDQDDGKTDASVRRVGCDQVTG